ncbi:HlyC/CorC family transporter [Terasakiella sp. A23]|uniref:HlyC/CorC family transporter n=1 Tax=Terasakiella sp. FCG-A23 TaxID=3080561 RepID=UPI0029529E1C|nr:HlyC/CorC family transporter [Terasakiella sp. A23]MDV7341384.1 HlyC/CorC family transporter [Terasakiella sp. A23]
MEWIVAAIFVLILFSAFFSGSETALTAASRPLMHQLEQNDDNKRAGIVNRLLDSKERLIGAILLGNNLVNILASALATSVMIHYFGEAGVVWATLVMTVVVLIFAEIMPKTFAIQNANKMALAIAPIMKVMVFVLAPITMTTQFIVAGTLKLFGAGVSEDEGQTAEELRGAINLHEGDGDEGVSQERTMLHSILDLQEVEVSEIMTHRKGVVMIDADLPAEDIVEQVLDSPFTRLPLYRDDPDNIIGVIHAKALLRAIRARKGDMEGLDVVELAGETWFIPEATSLMGQLEAFRARREHFAIVVDEYGSFMGIVTLEDILEEIVGDIEDEHDDQVEGVQSQIDGSYIVDGIVTIRDLNREFDWRLPDEEAATIAGLLLHEARRIPDIGQVFRFYNFRFEILDRKRNQITSIRVFPPLNDE